MSIQALRERRATIGAELKKLMDANPTFNAELQSKSDAMLAEVDGIDAQIKSIEAINAKFVDDAANASIVNAMGKKAGSTAAMVYDKLLRQGEKALSAEDWQTIRATMSTTTPAQGGYTVPPEVAKSIADVLKMFGGMRDVATVIRTDSGAPLNFPTSDGSAEVGELIGENTTATGADPAFGVVALNTYKFSSKIVAIPFELLQDSGVDMEAFIRGRLVQRLGRVTNQMFTTGTGTAQPNGVVTAAGLGKAGTTGQTTSIIFDDLVDLIHSVDPSYRALGNCKFMMNDSSLKVLRKMKDTAGRPVFLPGYDGLAHSALPDSVLGYPIVINQDIAAMGVSAKSILFGDFTFYTIRDAMDMSLFRFDDSAYAKLGQVGFLMWMRAGGNLVDVGGAVKYYQNSAT